MNKTDDGFEVVIHSDAIGCTFTDVQRGKGDEDNGALFFFLDEERVTGFMMTHPQDCCEIVELEDVVGDLSDLVGSPIVRFEERSKTKEDADSEETWTFYEIATNKGSVTLRWYGSSNGYYSTAVYFYKTNKPSYFVPDTEGRPND